MGMKRKQGSTVTETADEIHFDNAFVAECVADLERDGLIRKTGRTRDGEPVYIATEKGIAVNESETATKN